jgi:glyoxylase-like metal-dependent hydrolase (beta-lactamase superfamily II)
LSTVERGWFLTTGTLRSPAAAFALPKNAGGERRGLLGSVLSRVGADFRDLPIACLVLEHRPDRPGEEGDVTLVDTGLGAAQCRDPHRELGVTSVFLGVRSKAGDDLASQLEARGISRKRVKTILATHLHVDHVGGLVDFPDAEVVTTEDELASANQRGFIHGFDVAALAKVGRFRMARFHGKALHEFPGSCPAFGEDDGVTLLDARGHTAGSVAVAVQLGDRLLVHLGDSAYTLGEALREAQSPLAMRTSWDLERQRTTYRAIGRLTRRGDATLVTSHDPATWKEIEGRVFSSSA